MAYLFRNNVLGKFGINVPQKVEDTLYKNNNKFILVILEKKIIWKQEHFKVSMKLFHLKEHSY